MAWATKHYFNRNKFQVTLECVGGKIYYIPAKERSYVPEELAEGFTLPPNVLVYDNPEWWTEEMWPWTQPWQQPPQQPQQPQPEPPQ